jgi:threonine dehydratase
MVTIEQIRDAADALDGTVVRTRLVPLPLEGSGRSRQEIHLKLETEQPIGSFKIRGAVNRLRVASAAELRRGVWTASAGNMAQGAAWAARRLGSPCTVVVPESAPDTKLRAARRLGARIVKVPFEDWWNAMRSGEYPGVSGLFLPPFDDEHVMAGNATIGLEILEDRPDTDTVLVPWGGGGLACGIAYACRSVRPRTRVYAAEVATAAPLAASLAAGSPRTVDRRPSFVDGIGGTEVFPRMFDRAKRLLDGALVAGLEEVEEAIRILHSRVGVVAEGAGACPVAISLSGHAPGRKIVCVVSGGNIDRAELDRILGGAPHRDRDDRSDHDRDRERGRP